jgi:hypothetical protein
MLLLGLSYQLVDRVILLRGADAVREAERHEGTEPSHRVAEQDIEGRIVLGVESPCWR